MSMTLEEAITHTKVRHELSARMKDLLVDRLSVPVDPAIWASVQTLQS